MGRGRGKGKKLTIATSNEDPGSGAEESLPAYKRKGRPQKPMKDKPDEDEVDKFEDDDGTISKDSIPGRETKDPTTTDNEKKRRKKNHVKNKVDPIKEENGSGIRSNIDVSVKSNGFRQNGSRRKSKPQRAAEAGVECE